MQNTKISDILPLEGPIHLNKSISITGLNWSRRIKTKYQPEKSVPGLGRHDQIYMTDIMGRYTKICFCHEGMFKLGQNIYVHRHIFNHVATGQKGKTFSTSRLLPCRTKLF